MELESKLNLICKDIDKKNGKTILNLRFSKAHKKIELNSDLVAIRIFPIKLQTK